MAENSYKPLSILLAVHHFPPDRVAGAELFAYRLASGLLARGHRVQVVCAEASEARSRNGPIAWADQEYNGIPVRRLSLSRAASEPLRARYDDPHLAAHFSELIASRSPDLVHLISGYLLGIAPLRAAQAFGIPTVVSLTDFWFLCPTIQLLRGDGSLCFGPEPLECLRCARDEQRRFRWIDRHAPAQMQRFWHFAARSPALASRLTVTPEIAVWSERPVLLSEWLNRATLIAPVTKYLADVHATNGIDSTRFRIMPFGVRPLTAPPRDPSEPLHIGYLGQIAPVKGVETLIRAFRQLGTANREPRAPRRAKLFLHGALNAFPDYVRQLKAIAAEDAEISWQGAYTPEQLRGILANLDVVVVPSLWHENSPHVVLEAFAANRPVVGTKVGGIAELVQHGSNGLLFARGDAADLSRQLQRIIDEPGLLAELRSHIPPVRTVEEELDDWFELYRNATAFAHAPGAALARSG